MKYFLYFSIMEEIWKEIEGYPNYQVSNMGRVKSLNYNRTGKEKIMKLRTDKGGYLSVNFHKDKKQTTNKVHRLVAEAFIPNPENKPCIDHINTVRTDNRVENIRWATYKENGNNPISKNNYSTSHKGKNTKSVLQFTKEWELVKKWDSLREAELELGIKRLYKYCGNKYGCKSAGGYIWQYADDYERIPFKVFDLEMYRKRVV